MLNLSRISRNRRPLVLLIGCVALFGIYYLGFATNFVGLESRSVSLGLDPVLIAFYILFNFAIGISLLRVPIKAMQYRLRKGIRFSDAAVDFSNFVFWCGLKHIADVLIIFVGWFYIAEIFIILPLVAFFLVQANLQLKTLLPAVIDQNIALATVVEDLERAAQELAHKEVHDAVQGLKNQLQGVSLETGSGGQDGP